MKKLYIFRTLFWVFLLTNGITSRAQTFKETGSYSVINVKYAFSENWSAYIENQWRSLSFFDRFYYYELKAGATYKFHPNYSFTLGTGIYNTFNEGAEYEFYKEKFENRIWEQFNMEHRLAMIELDHRFRIEQRFSNQYANRFRYRLAADIPINKRTIQDNTLYGTVSNELFFTDDAPNFTRNRFVAGGGFRLPRNLKIELGFLRQVDFAKSSTRKKNYFFTSLGVTL